MSEEIQRHTVIFLLLPGAEAVSALGAFNNWSTVANPLRKLNGNEWEFHLPFPGFELERLSFFVVRHGAPYGSVIEYRDVKPLVKLWSVNESATIAEPQSGTVGESY